MTDVQRNDDELSPLLPTLEHDVLPKYLPAQRWYADKGVTPDEAHLLDAVELGSDGVRSYLAIVDLPQIARDYFVPVALAEPDAVEAPDRARLAVVPRGGHDGLLLEAFSTDAFVLALLADVRSGGRLRSQRGGTFVAYATDRFRALALSGRPKVRRPSVEQSNTSVVIDEAVMLKGYRRVAPGPQPELEVARFLDRVGYSNTPALYGWLEYQRPGAEAMVLAIVQRFVHSRGDAWSAVLAHLDDPAADDADVLRSLRTLGRRVAELHHAFATPTGDPAFEPEPVTQADLDAWVERAREGAGRALSALAQGLERVPDELRSAAGAVLDEGDALQASLRLSPLQNGERWTKTRYHGDLHLGQALAVDGDFQIVDFEGEPARDLAARRSKASPLRDVAGMLRSIDYAALATSRAGAEAWRCRARSAFLDGYRDAIAGCSAYPPGAARAAELLSLFVREKAFYELAYELANRPAWLRIPLAGIRGTDGAFAGD